METKKKLVEVQRDVEESRNVKESGEKERGSEERGKEERRANELQEELQKERPELCQDDELQVGSISETVARRESRKERKAKEGRKEGRKKEGTNLAGLKLQLLNFHFTLALVTGLNELVLTDEEAEMLAVALDGFIQEFGIAFSSKVAVAINLAVTMLSIYVPRLFMIMERKKKGEVTK